MGSELPQPLDLTRREEQVLRRLAAGETCEEIAGELDISPRTVRAYVDHLRAKLGVDRGRKIPMAYRARTGRDPLLLDP